MTSTCFFPTPSTIVQSIVRNEVEGDYLRVLEPAVGDGALLKALNGRYERLVAIDVDPAKLSKVDTLVDKSRSTLLCEDFVNYHLNEEFDLILSNPPFNNRIQNYFKYNGRSVPIEAYFVLKCLEYLSDGGKAIFILPSSIINGDKSRWIREFIIESYKILSIYKLPKFSFKRVEGAFYVLCLQSVRAKNYDVRLYKSCKLSYVINSKFLSNFAYTLDPETLSLAGEYEEIICTLGKRSILDFFDITRGSLCASGIQEYVYHSTDFKGHIAGVKVVGDSSSISGKELSYSDLIVKRVGRSVHKSFSIYQCEESRVFSDCVIRLRPLNPSENMSVSLLLRLRVAVELGANGLFMISGSGASYISMSRLRSICIPDSKHFSDPVFLDAYRKRLLSLDFEGASRLEVELAQSIRADYYSSSKCRVEA